MSDWWVYSLALNVACYSTVLLPGYLLIQHLKKRNYKETGSGFLYPYIVKFVYGDDVSELPGLIKTEKTEDSFTVKTIKLIVCAIGLQASFLTWGLLQERIMTM